MSTRAAFIFANVPSAKFGGGDEYCVYVHFDGYPEGAARYLARCLAGGMTWPLPRYEADEFAAGFVATIKTFMAAAALKRARARLPVLGGAGGNVRLMNRWDEAGDIEWAYMVKPAAQRGGLRLKAHPTRCTRAGRVMLRKAVYDGDLLRFLTKYGSPLGEAREEAAAAREAVQ